MTAADLDWLQQGLAEIEAALAADEWQLARELAAFVDGRTGGTMAHARVVDAWIAEVAA